MQTTEAVPEAHRVHADGATAWVVATSAVPWARLEALGHGLLDADERCRAERLHFTADRHAYVLAHALRRLVLGEVLGRDPAALSFVRDDHGRPHLNAAPRAPFFSLSHTRAGVAFAVADHPVGIDIESAEIANLDLTLLRKFIDRESAACGEHEGDFATCWTAMEAFWKARGTGLADGQPRLQLVRQGDDFLCVLLRDTAGQWTPQAGIRLLRQVPGCVCAMAVLR